MNRSSFGLRGASQAAPAPTVAVPVIRGARPAQVSLRVGADSAPEDDASSVDDDVRAWKAQRSFTIPWKQLCLMASICFGIASFVLPDDVNRGVNWLLYGLTAMSFWVWFKGRRARAKS
ncbi:MAG TPA: hypothetical protein VHW69_03970 [Rhizomicrobium sp.]|jgi:hypothetical protein|nr:hypothetical protein [Rhizomicrobium sp.]